MKPTLKSELPVIAMVLLPFVYLFYVWNHLPEKVPVHWSNGEIDRYGNKAELLLVPIALPLLVYVVFLVIPWIDPKRKLAEMGNKLQSIKFIVTTIMSLLALYIIYTTKNPGAFSAEYALILVGVLFMVLGNYFKTIRANYFLGIRTPWTLENEVVWRETHKLGGALWFVGGILVVINSIFIEGQLMHTIFMVITGIMVLVPVAYSYWKFNSLTRHEKSSGS